MLSIVKATNKVGDATHGGHRKEAADKEGKKARSNPSRTRTNSKQEITSNAQGNLSRGQRWGKEFQKRRRTRAERQKKIRAVSPL